jgi:hypothetical protein
MQLAVPLSQPDSLAQYKVERTSAGLQVGKAAQYLAVALDRHGSAALCVHSDYDLLGVLKAVEIGAPSANAPLVGTVSWGNHSDGYWKAMASIMPGEYTFSTRVPFDAPARAGTYHILFAFQLEYEASNVASGTLWVLHRDVWDDGNDIAEFTPSQIAQAQKYGCTVDRWLTRYPDDRYTAVVVPADAITVQVR